MDRNFTSGVHILITAPTHRYVKNYILTQMVTKDENLQNGTKETLVYHRRQRG